MSDAGRGRGSPVPRLVLLLAAIVALPLIVRPVVAAEIWIFSIAAMALNLIFGYTGMLSFGQATFFGLGAYTAGLMMIHWQAPLLAVLVAGIVVGAAADPAEAEDLVQETYLRALRFSHRFQPGTRLRAWLFQILRNTFLTFYRLREREAPLAEDGVPEWDVPMFHDAPDEDPGTREAATDLERAMRRLPEEFRTVLLLAEVEGMPLEEVAEVMACPVGTVKSRIFRAKERLRGFLRDYEDRRGRAAPAPPAPSDTSEEAR